MARTSEARERDLQALREARDAGDPAALESGLRDALEKNDFRLLALAARICGELLLHDFETALVAAFERIDALPFKRDPGCLAKGALLRALADLDCTDVGLFRDALHRVQLEPVWGGSQDTAADVRATAALGLAAAGHPGALVDLAALLWDPEAAARQGAVRAVGLLEPVGAQALLRAKATAGDPEPAVLGECLQQLLELDPEASIPFVAAFLEAPDEELAELAAFSLAESREAAAVAELRRCWEAAPFKGERQLALLRAAAVHRGDDNRRWLLEVLNGGNARAAAVLVEALALFRSDEKLARAVYAAVESCGEAALTECFEAHWGRSGAGPER